MTKTKGGYKYGNRNKSVSTVRFRAAKTKTNSGSKIFARKIKISLIVVGVIILILAGIVLAQEDNKQFDLEKIYYASYFELLFQKPEPVMPTECSVVFKECNSELNAEFIENDD